MARAIKERCTLCGELGFLNYLDQCEECETATTFPTDEYLGGTNTDYRINCADSVALQFDGEFYV